jgi:hypothetical protein
VDGGDKEQGDLKTHSLQFEAELEDAERLVLGLQDLPGQLIVSLVRLKVQGQDHSRVLV